MRRETRANLWFLILFLAISLPGAVILFRKKLDPTSPRLDQPDRVTRRLPYMAPPPAPPDVKWVVPDLTRQWLAEVVRPRGAALVSAAEPGPKWEPVISADHLLQVMIAANAGAAWRVELLLWQGTPELLTRYYSVHLDAGNLREDSRVTAVRQVAVPPEVRRELVLMGFVRPPSQVLMIDADFEALAPAASHVHLSLDYAGPPAPLHSSVDWVTR